MKKLISEYTFNAATKQITLTEYTSVDLESLLLITNVTDNIILYNFAGQDKGATIVGNVVTLDYDTSSMSNNDNLQIFIDDGQSPATNSELETLNFLIKQLLKRSESLAVVDINQRQRVTVDSVVPTVFVNGNNSTFRPIDLANNSVYELFSGATYNRYCAVPDIWRTTELARQSYQQCIRANLTF